MAKFRKKPVEVEAVRLTERVEIQTLEGTMIGQPGDWLITGIAGEQYPCKDEIFRATYTRVEGTDTDPLFEEEEGMICISCGQRYHNDADHECPDTYE